MADTFKPAIREIFNDAVSGYRENRPSKFVTFTLDVGGFTFDQLMNLAKLLGTTHIEFEHSTSTGCPTCGPDSETCFEATKVIFPKEVNK